jgi:hypothetical protein
MTKIFIVVIIAIITVFDMYMLNFKGYDATISWEIYKTSQDFAFGRNKNNDLLYKIDINQIDAIIGLYATRR